MELDGRPYGRCNSVQVTAQGQYTSPPAKTRLKSSPPPALPAPSYPPLSPNEHLHETVGFWAVVGAPADANGEAIFDAPAFRRRMASIWNVSANEVRAGSPNQAVR